ncbi:MAG: Slp family lipoprotein [Candidatus Brocadiaceae baterium WH-1]|uniref:Slp family lipoprotein n=1 Tax=Candidatus Loosdrechtia sp. TaxID=3101272 RepID=UPI003A6911E3|nr:MAG: Slp family lipoprotein [Candidatus Jettenia sp. AMX2]
MTGKGAFTMQKKNNLYSIPRKLLITLSLLATIAGCAPVISKQLRQQIEPDLTAEDILKDPDRYTGKVFMVSGTILETEITEEGTFIKILHRPATFRGRPKDVDESAGRFLALTDRYLDPVVYAKDRSITVAGEILGKRTLPLGKIQYDYPLIHAREIYLWPLTPELSRPYPYPYPYYYDHWWWRRGYWYY